MKKITLLALCAALIAIVAPGCVSVNFAGTMQNGSPVTGRGELEQYTFNVSEITEIKVELFCNVEYYAAPSNTVTLEIQPNLMEFVTVEESGGILTVRSSRTINWSGWPNTNVPVLTVSTPALNRLNLMGAGSFTTHDTITADSFALDTAGALTGSADFDVDSITVSMSGAGDIKLTGIADTAWLSMSGAGSLNALELRTRDTNINLAGAATVKISCSESLTINAGGVGSIEYRGNPRLDLTRGGMVSIRQVD